MTPTLVKNTHYNGKYVALKGFDDHTIVGSGTTPAEAHERALRNGCENPVITFVPTKDLVQIY